eukprot:SAG31_NODE_6345_length_2055_cov_1.034765_4_plen_72_part_00
MVAGGGGAGRCSGGAVARGSCEGFARLKSGFVSVSIARSDREAPGRLIKFNNMYWYIAISNQYQVYHHFLN